MDMRALIGGSPVRRGPDLALHGEERWFVVRTQPHREAKAEQQLANQNYRMFLPRFLKSRRHARKFETIWAPLFPGYLFVILDLTRDRWRSVNGTYGVDRLLTRAGAPEPVPHGLVEQLLVAANPAGVVNSRLELEEGQTVRVTAGPFADLLGRLATKMILEESGCCSICWAARFQLYCRSVWSCLALFHNSRRMTAHLSSGLWERSDELAHPSRWGEC